ncbi:PREDICTED: uncharacterized protein LOC109187786 isoform X2 [Ipomoea nil]|uniref:uncharacterized protein LOC109187786 isoform X2 n=1 Tax=Ipomoea nil TaxID=35883 RepID=UPI000900869B|nr:PREDICTED: uncharacterized protein LOC109187786 isoform X2 [Ipomoea nil]
MDLKAKSWAGNMYNKFEDLCSEVEQVMSQDAVKYVENQVQTVGVRVKKFCSEVMEKKPKSSLKEHARGIYEKLMEDAQVIKSGGKSKHGGVYKRRNVGVTSNSLGIDPPVKMARTSSPPSGMRNRTPLRFSEQKPEDSGFTSINKDQNLESDKLKKADGIQQEVETVEQIKGSHLMETCVMVGEDKVHVPQEPVKQNSYKIKIWSAFSSSRRREYQHLAALSADQPLNAEAEEKAMSDSEWELL